jgi:hypothetical protein
MGTWGTGLYSGDFATDLRATIGAVSRLPFAADRLVDILCETETAAATDADDEHHTTFWLIVADQFAKRGITSERVREKALGIIAAGDDVAMLEKRGMNPTDIRKRRGLLEDLRARIVAAPADTPRSVLKNPQPLLMDRGDVLAYPTCGGKCLNPYFAFKERNKRYTTDGPMPWLQDGWAAAVILDCGRAFEFLSWYRPLTLATAAIDKPTPSSLRGDLVWRLEGPGTCSPTHFKRMELEKIGNVPVDPDKVRTVFPGLRPGISAAVGDISIANRLHVAPHAGSGRSEESADRLRARTRIIRGIEQILSGAA